MATLRLVNLYPEPMINPSDGKTYIQLTGLDAEGAVWTLGPQGWIAVSMEIMSTENRAAAAGIEIVN